MKILALILLAAAPTISAHPVPEAFCVFSQKHINNLFLREGLGKDVWGYSSPIVFDKLSSGRGLYLSGISSREIFHLDESGALSTVMSRGSGVVFPLGETMPGVRNADRSITVYTKDETTFRKRPDESVPIADINGELMGRCFNREVSKFEIVAVNAPDNVRYTGQGILCWLNSDQKSVAILSAQGGALFEYSEISRDKNFNVTKSVAVDLRAFVRSKYTIDFADIDASRRLIAFVENPMASEFALWNRPMPKLYLYDLREARVVLTKEIKSGAGGLYGFFLSDRLVAQLRPSFALSSQEVAKLREQ